MVYAASNRVSFCCLSPTTKLTTIVLEVTAEGKAWYWCVTVWTRLCTYPCLRYSIFLSSETRYMPIVVDGVRLGMTYLSIDLVLTFIAHSAEENARNLPLSGRVKSFLRAHSLFALHHVVTGGFILPLGMVSTVVCVVCLPRRPVWVHHICS